jgi:hypothetical protein
MEGSGCTPEHACRAGPRPAHTSTCVHESCYTMGHIRSATVFMPVLSLLFLEDLATAFAWLHHHDDSLETIEGYVTLLRSKKAADFPGEALSSSAEGAPHSTGGAVRTVAQGA